MRRGLLISLILMGILGLLLSACTPTPEPSRASIPVPPAQPQANPAQAAPAPKPEDIAWNKVIQAAKNEGKVTAYSFNMTGDVGLAVSRSFEQIYGIKVDIITGGGAALVQRITTEKRMGTMVADVMDANTFQIGQLEDAGITASSEDIPVLKETGVWIVEPWANSPKRHVLIHTITFYPNIINTDLVKPSDEPKSLKELTQAKWKGRMAVFDPRQNSTLSTAFPVFLNRKLIDQDTVQRLGMNDIKYYPVSDEPARNVIQGQQALYLLGSTGTMGSLITKAGVSVPVKAIDTEEGTLATNRAIGAIKDGPHPNAARVLINWLLTQEGQNVFAKAQGVVPVRKDVPDFTPKELRFTPSRLIIPTAEEEKDSTRIFREGWLAKLWGR